jgi:hypothetical protein
LHGSAPASAGVPFPAAGGKWAARLTVHRSALADALVEGTHGIKDAVRRQARIEGEGRDGKGSDGREHGQGALREARRQERGESRHRCREGRDPHRRVRGYHAEGPSKDRGGQGGSVSECPEGCPEAGIDEAPRYQGRGRNSCIGDGDEGDGGKQGRHRQVGANRAIGRSDRGPCAG